MPSDWVTHEKTSLLSASQVEALAAKARTRLGTAIETIPGTSRKIWYPTSRQIYADVAKNGKPDRIDTFNGNYGLSRGLAAAMFAIAIVSFAHGQIGLGFGFLFVGGVYVYRAYRFARYYARELYVQFLVLDAPKTETA